jgi:hypothetical protein
MWYRLECGILRFILCWEMVPERFPQPTVSERRDRVQRRVVHVVEGAPRARVAIDLCRVPSDQRFRERIIVRTPAATDGHLAAGGGNALGVTNGYVLRSSVAMVDVPRVNLRSWIACSSESSARSVRIDALARPLTMRRENASITNAP